MSWQAADPPTRAWSWTSNCWVQGASNWILWTTGRQASRFSCSVDFRGRKHDRMFNTSIQLRLAKSELLL
jgi:hypothetical protein